MTQYKFNASGSSQTGNLGWNANSTLKTLGITDPFNAGNAQNCSYAYDDLSRLSSASCGSAWAQSFAYDAFGNATKSGSSSWQPNYNTKNQYQSIPGFPNPGPTYDANGDLLTDSFHTYTWDAEGHVTGIDSIGLTYDALGRQVEQNQSGTYFQIVYSPMGQKLAVMKGQTIQQAFVPLPGGTTAEYLSWGLSHYRHPDWLGSERLESGTAHNIIQDTAYAPFGEPYAELSGGNGEISFTGQNKDTDWLNYDFMYREYDPRQSRWISPDPAGIGAVNPGNPQSWNRYAYVLNNPLGNLDPLGLSNCDGVDDLTFYADCSAVPIPPQSGDLLPPPSSEQLPSTGDGIGSTSAGPTIGDSYSWMPDGYSPGPFQPGTLAYNTFGPPSAHLWQAANGTMEDLTAAYAAGFATAAGAPAVAAAGNHLAFGAFAGRIFYSGYGAYTAAFSAAGAFGGRIINSTR